MWCQYSHEIQNDNILNEDSFRFATLKQNPSLLYLTLNYVCL